MTQRTTRSTPGLLPLVLAFLLGVGAFAAAWLLGWFSIFGDDSRSRDSQVIQAIERTQQISLLSLGIQGIKDEDKCATVFGKCIPSSSEKVFLRYNFTAKLGLDGADVEVEKTGESAYLITVPKFISIGFSKPTFEVAVEDGSVLDWVTPDIDKVEMINEVLNADTRRKYIASNRDLLEDQTEVFYDRLIKSIDPAADTTFEFAS